MLISCSLHSWRGMYASRSPKMWASSSWVMMESLSIGSWYAWMQETPFGILKTNRLTSLSEFKGSIQTFRASCRSSMRSCSPRKSSWIACRINISHILLLLCGSVLGSPHIKSHYLLSFDFLSRESPLLVDIQRLWPQSAVPAFGGGRTRGLAGGFESRSGWLPIPTYRHWLRKSVGVSRLCLMF